MTNYRAWPSMGLASLLVLASLSAWAQYKVVGPDGRVTYTDRPPVAGSGNVSNLGRPNTAAAPAPGSDLAALPSELRPVVSRFPVLLYTGNECPPCDAARQFLQQRGIPFTERRIATEDDSAALDRLVGGRTIPSLTIGGQALRGFASADWAAYLDAAGYPKESRLPRGWQAPPATPLVERAAPVPAASRSEPVRPAPRPAPAPPPPATAEEDSESPAEEPTIKF